MREGTESLNIIKTNFSEDTQITFHYQFMQLNSAMPGWERRRGRSNNLEKNQGSAGSGW
jgi:hypothetical protein